MRSTPGQQVWRKVFACISDRVGGHELGEERDQLSSGRSCVRFRHAPPDEVIHSFWALLRHSAPPDDEKQAWGRRMVWPLAADGKCSCAGNSLMTQHVRKRCHLQLCAAARQASYKAWSGKQQTQVIQGCT